MILIKENYISSIAIKHEGGIEITGTIGTKLFLFYTVKQAITRYNKMAKSK